MSRLLALLLVCLAALSAGPGGRAAELVMFLAGNCEWCEVWEKEIGVIYPKTDEARTAPLRRIEIFHPRPADLAKLKGVHYTPTFVLIDGGKEIGRIIGYPGEDFFWELLGGLIKKLPAESRRACAVPGAGTEGGKIC
ncbi:MAG: thioredoxin family protein [Rhodospirillaceae bacterium]